MGAMRLIVAGGGSGGHFFPALAIMNEMIQRNEGIEYMYVGSDAGIESRKWTLPERNRRLLTVQGFRNKTVSQKLFSAVLLARALHEAGSIIREFAPDAVLGVGGYASFPILMSAVIRRIPSAVHEQNSVPGLANKVLARFVDRVFITFGTSADYLPGGKTRLTGLPIRYTAVRHKTFDSRVRTILVLGGSQGAHQVNDMMVRGLDNLMDMRDRVRFIHQTGATDLAVVREAYGRRGFTADVVGFIDDMARVFDTADIAVSRAGASTLSELAVFGVPSILLPYPSAAADHQTLNANEIAAGGGAVVLPAATQDPGLLVSHIRTLADDPVRLQHMSGAMTAGAKPGAAAAIVDELKILAGKGTTCTRE